MTFIRQVALLAIFLIATLPAQHRSPSDSLIIPVLGTVKAISVTVIYVDSGGHVTSVSPAITRKFGTAKHLMIFRWS